MYLRELYIRDIGPIERLAVTMPFDGSGRPRPLVFLGANGSGKTNVLSIVADSLMEAASQHFHNVGQTVGGQRQYFRVVGSTTRRVGAPSSLTILKYDHAGLPYFFIEKSGTIDEQELSGLPAGVRGHPGLPSEEHGKAFPINRDLVHEIFAREAICFFPTSRAETPNWLNRNAVPNEVFSIQEAFVGQLGKPLFLERGLDGLVQWLMSLILESRANFSVTVGPRGPEYQVAGVDVPFHLSASTTLHWVVQILREVLNEPTAVLTWLGRRQGAKIGISYDGGVRLADLHGLSAGQATLFSIFGTLVRYGDHTGLGITPTLPSEVLGVCVVDEVDAHMHVDLQRRALPNLISMFPKVQFILSCHSPLFVAGLVEKFGAGDVSLVSLPDGRSIDAEAYSEFSNAFEVMKGTKAFAKAVADEASIASEGPLVFVEGETDPDYLTAAAQALDRAALLNRIRIKWIGAKQADGATNFHSGKDALNHTYAFLKANPNVVRRPILLLYDNDAAKPPTDDGTLHVRSMPSNERNTVVVKGIENLLPPSVFTDEVYDTTFRDSGNGKTTTTRSLKKSLLCQRVCARADLGDFERFADVLDMIEAAFEGSSGD